MRFHSFFAIITLLFSTEPIFLRHPSRRSFSLVRIVRQDFAVTPSVSGSPRKDTRYIVCTSSLGRDEEHDDGGLTVFLAIRGRAREEESGMVGGEKKWKVSERRWEDGGTGQGEEIDLKNTALMW